MSLVVNYVEHKRYPRQEARGPKRKSCIWHLASDFVNALGSASEVKVLLEMIKDLGYMEAKEFEEVYETYDHLARQIYRLIESWK